MTIYLQHQLISLTIKTDLWFDPKLWKKPSEADIICPDIIPICYLLKYSCS